MNVQFNNRARSWNWKLFLFCCFCLCSLQLSCVSGSSCVSFPVSLSDITNCVSGVCELVERAVIKIPAHTGATGCVELTLPDNSNTTYKLEVNTNSFYYRSRPDYCYYTDDVAADSKCKCGCPLGTPVSAKSCPVDTAYSDVMATTETTIKDDYCAMTALFGTPGKYCTKTTLSGKSRFKVCHHYKYTEDANFEITLFNSTFPIHYSGNLAGTDIVNITQGNNLELTVNVTIVDDTTLPEITPEFTVIDAHQAHDFYMLTAADVNSLNGYNYDKIGWYKSNMTQKAPTTLAKDIKATLLSCQNDVCQFDYPWQSTVKRLEEKKNLLAGQISPNAFLIDDHTTGSNHDVKSGAIDHVVEPYYYMKEGIMYYDYDGRVRFCGVDLQNKVRRGTALSNVCFKGVLRDDVSTVTVVNVTEMHICDLDSTKRSIGFFVSNGGYTWAVQVPDTTYPPAKVTSFAPTMSATTTLCGSAKKTFMNPFVWEATGDGPYFQFPSRTDSTVSYSDAEGLNMEDYRPSPKQTELFVPSVKGEIEVAITFKNMKIQFEDVAVRPEVNSVWQDTFDIAVRARSTTSPGDCYISSEPGDIISAQVITLTNVHQEYRFPIATAYYSDPATIYVTCARQQIAKVIDVSVNRTEKIVDFELTNNTWTDTLNTINPLNFFRSAENAYDGAKWTWWDWVKLTVFLALSAIVITIVTAVIVKIYRCSIRRRGMSAASKRYEQLLARK